MRIEKRRPLFKSGRLFVLQLLHVEHFVFCYVSACLSAILGGLAPQNSAFCFAFKLIGIKIVVMTFFGKQLFVVAFFYDFALVDD